MRTAFFILLAANLAFLAWAGWIDRSGDSRMVESKTRLPPLLFAGEKASPSGEPVPAKESEKDAAKEPSKDSKTKAADKDAARVNAPRKRTTTADARTTATDNRCLLIGPFNDSSRSLRAATLLRERGFTPRQRTASGETWTGFWVYVGGLKSEAEQADILRKLEAAGIMDAHSMPDTNGERQVSVGLFRERGGAEGRARAVSRLGLKPQIAERSQAGTVYWVELDLDSSKQAVPTEGLLALEESGTRLEMKPCPREA